MSWLASSLMARKGVAKGRETATAAIRIADQPGFRYVYGPYAEPVISVRPGAVLTIETHDAFEGKIVTEADLPSKVLTFPFLNPQTGPVFVEGAEKGDCLAVHIRSIRPRGPQPVGTTCVVPEFGGLVGTGTTAMLNRPLEERVRKVPVDENGVYWSPEITLPYEPFIGTIGVSPEIEAISSLQPDYYGGNMDLPDMAPGAIAYFPVQREGALLFVGDCHAIQGDGEVSGVALEMPATVELHVDLIKNHPIAWPRLETAERVMTIGCARPLEDAARIAYRELVRWFAAEKPMDEIDAYMFLTQAAKVRLGNMVDPKYCMAASISKKYFAG
jgi:acetamidase/formamidase